MVEDSPIQQISTIHSAVLEQFIQECSL